jgi:hypothetical protein
MVLVEYLLGRVVVAAPGVCKVRYVTWVVAKYFDALRNRLFKFVGGLLSSVNVAEVVHAYSDEG